MSPAEWVDPLNGTDREQAEKTRKVEFLMKVVEMVDITSKCDMENLVEPSASGYEDLSGDLPRRRSRSSGSFKLSRPLPLPSTFSPSPKRHASGERVGRANTVRSETRNRGKARIVEFRSPGHLLPDREREWDRFAGIDGASSSSSGYLARVLTPPDSVPPKRFEKPAAAIKARLSESNRSWSRKALPGSAH